MRALLCCLALALFGAAPARAQYFAFGQNKIHYRDFDWRVLKGPHVDLYFYPAEAELAAVALKSAEASYDTLSLQFGHEVAARIPLVVYASHTDFEQTNLLPFTPPEGLLGVTEFLKRRVALPFRGNVAEFRHTLRHELVHVFQLSLQSESRRRVARGNIVLPLWWTEGLAELWSGGEDARDEMILRDLTLSGRLPPIEQLEYYTGGLVYPLGGRFHRWLADTYGDWRVGMLYRELALHESFEKAIASIYGRSLSQLGEEFQLAMRRTYYPTAETHVPLTVAARELATLAIKPAYVPDTVAGGVGDVVYSSPADGYVTIYRRALEPDSSARSIATGGRSEGIESFHPFDSRVDASRPGVLLFSARHGDRDAVVVWDLDEQRIAGRYQFPQLVSIVSPAWMPDGRSIVFSGLAESGFSNLFRLWLEGGELEALTEDHYQDLDPSPSPDGTRLVFASDRTAGGADGAVNLFVLDLETRAIRQLTSGQWVDESPAWSDDGRIVFTSGRDGVLNVFSVDSLGSGRRETSAWTGAFDGVPLPDDRGLLVTGFQGLSWGVYQYPADSAARADTFALAAHAEPATWSRDVGIDSAGILAAGKPYRTHFTLDFAAGDAAFIPGYGGAQGVAFLLSDMLGDHLIFGSVSSFQGDELGSIVENLNVSGLYLNQKNRINWGVGAFRTRGRYFDGEDFPAFFETAIGGLALVRYPLSRNTRVDGTFVFERSDRTDFTSLVEEPRRVGWIASNIVSFVHDNSLWISSGPIDGGRFSITAGASSDFSNGRFDSFLLSGDWRRYFRLGRQSAWALRAFGFYGDGNRPRRVNIGGTLGIRGYPLFGRIVGTRGYLFNQELRFPLLRHLTFGTPVGDLRLPQIQAAIFTDMARAWYDDDVDRAILGSAGISFRLAVAPLAVLRLDVGRRFATEDFEGYSLTQGQRESGFVSFFFGYNY